MGSPLLWTVFIVVIGMVLALDLGLLNRRAHSITFREAVNWSLLWFTLAMAFAAGVFIHIGREDGMQFLTGYIIELSLSVDNVFLFVLLFSYFQVPPRYQHRVLIWGVLSAFVMRGVMIAAGAALLERFHWIIYLFGGFLILTGVKMLMTRHEDTDPGNSRLMKWVRKHIPLTEHYDGQKFFTYVDGKRLATPLFLILVMIECTDLVFALDSIPAIFGITQDPFLVFTSNVFAILGLRSLYFVLSGVMQLFHYLTLGLSAILIFVGFKMLGIVHISIEVSLGVIGLILAVSIIASLVRARRHRAELS